MSDLTEDELTALIAKSMGGEVSERAPGAVNKSPKLIHRDHLRSALITSLPAWDSRAAVVGMRHSVSLLDSTKMIGST